MYNARISQERQACWLEFITLLICCNVVMLPILDPTEIFRRTNTLAEQIREPLFRLAQEDQVGPARPAARSSVENTWSARIEVQALGEVYFQTFPLDQDNLFEDTIRLVGEAYERFFPFNLFIIRPNGANFQIHFNDQATPLHVLSAPHVPVTPLHDLMQSMGDILPARHDPTHDTAQKVAEALALSSDALRDAERPQAGSDPLAPPRMLERFVVEEEDDPTMPELVDPAERFEEMQIEEMRFGNEVDQATQQYNMLEALEDELDRETFQLMRQMILGDLSRLHDRA
jgi:hypothetical protein